MNSTALTALFVPIVGLLLYRRFRHAFVRQRLVLWGMAVRFVLLAGLATAVIVRSPSRLALGVELGALVVGLGIALLGIKYTKLELTTQGVFYTPNKWIGLAVTALFVGRLASRMFMTYSQFATDPVAAAHDGQPAFMLQTSAAVWTLGFFVLLAGYYCAYYVGVWLRSRALRANPLLDPPQKRNDDDAEADRGPRVRRDTAQ